MVADKLVVAMRPYDVGVCRQGIQRAVFFWTSRAGCFFCFGVQEGMGNVFYYDRLGAVYDAIIGPALGGTRGRAVAALGLGADSRLLVSGVGSGLDLPYLPPSIRGVGIDTSEGMMRRVRHRCAGLERFEIRKMDAMRLDFPDASFDAVYLPLIVTVVPDGSRTLSEAGRVVRPGGRIVVLDWFWPEGRGRPRAARWFGDLAGAVATRPDLRFSEVLAAAPTLEIISDEPVHLHGFFRLITLQKPEG